MSEPVPFPADRWQPAKPKEVRVFEPVRFIKHGDPRYCEMVQGCRRKARYEILSSGRCYCPVHYRDQLKAIQ